MLKRIIFLWAVLLCPALASTTFGDAQAVYNQLVKANHIYNAPYLSLSASGSINAHNGFFGIVINQGMLDFLKNNNELAVVLGHELAHFTQHDHGSNYAVEYRADRIGAIYAGNAGYNRCEGVKLLLRFPHVRSKDHPYNNDRYDRVKCLVIA
jgi:beta-barrel assembly-enhancing protease